jgi:outer membrane protein assembly factor BamB
MDADGVACVLAFGHPPAADGIYLAIHRASDGKMIRSLRTDLTGWMSCAPAVADFRGIGVCDVAVSCWDARRIAMIDGRSGATLWYQPTEQPNMGGIAAGDLVGDGSADVVATSLDGHVYALQGKDGKLIWKTAGAQYASWSPPNIAALDGKGAPQVLVTTVAGQLYVLDGSDGKELWSPDVASGGKVGGRAVVAPVDGRSVILAPMGSAGVVAFDWPSRKELWRSPEGRPVIAAPAVADIARDGKRQVVVGTTGGDVFVLDLVTGNPLWHMKVAQGLIEADPVVADLDGGGVDDILIASHDSHLYAISGKTILDAMHRRAAVSRPVK